MPISKINEDGTVQIYNSKTGEIKDVRPEELATYNPAMVGEYLKMTNKGTDPVSELARVKAEQELKAIESGETAEIGTSEQQFKTKAASRAIDELERVYGRGEGANVGTGEDLSLSPSASGLARGATKIKRALAGFLGFNNELTEDIQKFKSQRDIAVGILTQAMGSGTPQEGEAKRLIQSMPDISSTDEEAKAWFASVRSLIGGGKEVEKKNEEVAQPTATPTGMPVTTEQPVVPTQETPPNETMLGKMALKVADVAPGVGGLMGGIAGGALGLGVASAATGAGGAAAGYGAGKVIQNSIRNLLGSQDKTPIEQVKDATTGAAKEAALDALGWGIGKYVFTPIVKGGGLLLRSLAKNVDDIPLKSIRVNPSQLTNFAKKTGTNLADFMVNRGYLGEEAIELAAQDAAKFQDAFDNLALNKNILIPIQEIGQRFSDEIAELAGKGQKIVPSFNKQMAEKLLKEWDFIQEQAIRQGRGVIGLDELTDFRRMVDELIPKGAFVSRNVKNLQLKLRGIINDIVQKTVDKTMLTEVAGEGSKGGLKDLGQELSRLYDFLEIAEKQQNLGKGSLVANLTKILSGGGGGIVGATVGGLPGAIIGGAAGLGLESSLRDPNVLKYLYKTGSTLVPKTQGLLTKLGQIAPRSTAIATQALGQLLGQ